MANNETYFSHFYYVLGLLINANGCFKGTCQHFLVSATEVPEIVINLELFAISSMCEVRSEHKACFGAYKVF